MAHQNPHSPDPSDDQKRDAENTSGDAPRLPPREQIGIGTEVGPYKITQFLGRGGFAEVFAAKNKQSDELVVLKRGSIMGGGRQVTRLLEVTSKKSLEGISPDVLPAEAIILGRGAVPSIDVLDATEVDGLLESETGVLREVPTKGLVEVVDTLEFGGRPVTVLQRLRGKTLRDKIRNLEGIHLKWLSGVVQTLENWKQNGGRGYHGDLKPENIIIQPSGSAVLIDPSSSTVGENCFVTTPHYNPLLLRESKADVMAIGIMTYELLTGTLPFDVVPWEYAHPERAMKPIGERERLSLSYMFSYTPPSTLNPRTPEALEQVVYRCITVPDYGFEELRKDLTAYIARS